MFPSFITPERTKRLYKHIKKFYIVESIVKIVSIAVLLIYKNSSLPLIGILVIASAPLSTIQKYNNVTLVNTIYNAEARKLHDLYYTKYDMIARAIAMGVGFLVNVFVPPILSICYLTVSGNYQQHLLPKPKTTEC